MTSFYVHCTVQFRKDDTRGGHSRFFMYIVLYSIVKMTPEVDTHALLSAIVLIARSQNGKHCSKKRVNSLFLKLGDLGEIQMQLEPSTHGLTTKQKQSRSKAKQYSSPLFIIFKMGGGGGKQAFKKRYREMSLITNKRYEKALKCNGFCEESE